MPQWEVGELGYLLAIAGFVLISFEWYRVFRAQGSTLARDALRLYLTEWQEAKDRGDAPVAQTRQAIIARMKAEADRIAEKHQRDLFKGYISDLAKSDPSEYAYLKNLDRSFDVGTAIDEERSRPFRAKLMGLGVLLVVLGTGGQMIGSWRGAFGPFCATKEWTCPQSDQSKH